MSAYPALKGMVGGKGLYTNFISLERNLKEKKTKIVQGIAKSCGF